MDVAFQFDQMETAELLMERGYNLPIPMGGERRLDPLGRRAGR